MTQLTGFVRLMYVVHLDDGIMVEVTYMYKALTFGLCIMLHHPPTHTLKHLNLAKCVKLLLHIFSLMMTHRDIVPTSFLSYDKTLLCGLSWNFHLDNIFFF